MEEEELPAAEEGVGVPLPLVAVPAAAAAEDDDDEEGISSPQEEEKVSPPVCSVLSVNDGMRDLTTWMRRRRKCVTALSNGTSMKIIFLHCAVVCTEDIKCRGGEKLGIVWSKG